MVGILLCGISQLVIDVGSSLLALGELDEKEGEAGVVEEFLLRFLGVLVHGVSDHLEVDRGALDHLLDIFLLEVVAEHNGQDSRGKL